MRIFESLGTVKDELHALIKMYRLDIDEEYLNELTQELLLHHKKGLPIMPWLYEVPNKVKQRNYSKKRASSYNQEVRTARRYCQYNKIAFSSDEEAWEIHKAFKERVAERRKLREENKSIFSEYKKVYCLIDGKELEFPSLTDATKWYSREFNISYKGAKSALYRSTSMGVVVNGCLFYRKVSKLDGK